MSESAPAPATPPPAPGPWNRLTARFGSGGAILLACLAAMLATSVTYAIEGETPWGRTVQKRLEKKQPLTPKEYAVIGSWWGAVANAGLLALLLATAGRWMPRPTPPTASIASESADAEAGARPAPQGAPSAGRSRWIWLGLVAAVGLGAWLRAPRLHHSLWNDEEYAMRRFAHGAWEPQKDGAWAFEPVTWTDTLFENRNGNNHVLNSLITRAALDAWRLATGAPRDAFSESALRLPAFIAGALTILMVFLIGRRAGGPVVGLGAAFLLALCPWHLRYAVEAKGYSFMLLFACVAIHALARALEENRLRWWLAFAVGQAAFLLSFAGSVYVAAALNLVAAIELLKRGEARRILTLAAASLLAAIPVIQLMLPSVPQLLAYLRSEDSLHLDTGWPWLRDFFSGLVIGFQFDNPFPKLHSGTSWLIESAAHPWLPPLAWILGALLIAGAACALATNTAARMAIAAPLLAAVAAYAHNRLAGSPMVVWYLLYAVIPASLAVPLALAKLTARIHPWAPAGITIVGVLATAVAVHGPAQRLRSHPRQPLRETVAWIRQNAPNAVTATFGVSDRQTLSYDPKVRILEKAEDLRLAADLARREQRPLVVYFCGTIESGKRRPDLMEALSKGLGGTPGNPASPATRFTEAAAFPGTEEMFSYRIHRADPPDAAP